MSPEGKKELDKIRKARGYTLPVHDTLADLNPEFLRRYGDLATYTLFGPPEGRALDLKTLFLVLIGVMLMVESTGTHISKGIIYFAMAFSLGIEVLNMRMRSRRQRVLDKMKAAELKAAET